MKKKFKIITYTCIGIYISLLTGTLIAYHDYVSLCLNEFFKMIMSYIYFPTTVQILFSVVLITAIMIYTLFSKKITKFKKVFNYVIFSILFFFFTSFISVCAYNGIDLGSSVDIYSNDNLLVLAQMNNILLLFWFIYTFFYKLYNYFKKKFD